MFGQTTVWEILVPALDLVFDVWPLMFVGALQGRRNRLRVLMAAWGIWAAFRLLLIFNPDPIGSFLIPEPLNTVLFFVTGAVLLVVQLGIYLWKNKSFKRKTEGIQNVADLLELSPREFEDWIVGIYRALGHRAKRTGSRGDHGVDVVVKTQDGEKWVVQCKRWRGKVGEPVIRDFYGVIHHEKADQGAIVTTGQFTAPARRWAKGKPLFLYDGQALLETFQRVQARKS